MDWRVKHIIRVIEENHRGEFSEQAMSRSVNLSPSRLRDLFKKETGLSPMRYVRRLRLKKAETLLRTSFLSIKEVIFQSGAGDASHFVRAFKKEYGVTPSAFRAQAGFTSKTFTGAVKTGD